MELGPDQCWQNTRAIDLSGRPLCLVAISRYDLGLGDKAQWPRRTDTRYQARTDIFLLLPCAMEREKGSQRRLTRSWNWRN
ncbi:hypothetical protein BP00DRAFT_186226 [Aspergillus indologenus CBS 114.80]|uniref:Uncharacterized protein n=1 Tax=Aspergillus indologenus CBS 114.80 TaxID=1450541 RepID=A0A2V5IAF6_9EURO|nr:hypothetical protein BP00DRAFT_186226 [Aspergillus indologenus CBS 114.80]